MLGYLGALLAVARVDGVMGARERTWIHHVGTTRWGVAIDDDVLVRAEQAWRDAAPEIKGDLGLALIEDAVVLAIIDGPVNELEVGALIELARAAQAPDDFVLACARRVR